MISALWREAIEELSRRKLRTLLTTYHAADGKHAIVLFHDEAHGAALIDALARHGDGLPARVLLAELLGHFLVVVRSRDTDRERDQP